MDKYFGRKVQTTADPMVCQTPKKARKIAESYRQQGRDRDAHERGRSLKRDAPVRFRPADIRNIADAFVSLRSTVDIIPKSGAKTKSGTSKPVCACGDYAHPDSYLPKGFYTNSASNFSDTLEATKKIRSDPEKCEFFTWISDEKRVNKIFE